MDKSQIIAVIVAIFASTGFWSYLGKRYDGRREKEKNKTVSPEQVNDLSKAVLGLLHNEIFKIGNDLVAKHEITLDEYDNFIELYKPYEKLGGNGTGKKLKVEVDRLPIV